MAPAKKACSDLADAEMACVLAVVRKTTLESFCPVRSVRRTLVFELWFEAIARGARRKSGIAVRFLRVPCWSEDQPVEVADSMRMFAALLRS